jgi:hypothetical protein
MIEVFRNGIKPSHDCIRLDDNIATIRSGWYNTNYKNPNLGVSLNNCMNGCQIEIGSETKATILFSVGEKDNDLYVIILNLQTNLRTTYILKKDASTVEVETEKYNPKIPFFYGKKGLDPIPKEDLYKTFFSHFKLGVGPLGYRTRYNRDRNKWGFITK